MNHKRRKPKNTRAGCLMCKPWKVNGFGKRKRKDGEKFSDHKRRYFANTAAKNFIWAGNSVRPE